MPLHGDGDVRVGDAWVLLEDPAWAGAEAGAEVIVFIAGEVGAWGRGDERLVRREGWVVAGDVGEWEENLPASQRFLQGSWRDSHFRQRMRSGDDMDMERCRWWWLHGVVGHKL